MQQQNDEYSCIFGWYSKWNRTKIYKSNSSRSNRIANEANVFDAVQLTRHHTNVLNELEHNEIKLNHYIQTLDDNITETTDNVKIKIEHSFDTIDVNKCRAIDLLLKRKNGLLEKQRRITQKHQLFRNKMNQLHLEIIQTANSFEIYHTNDMQQILRFFEEFIIMPVAASNPNVIVDFLNNQNKINLFTNYNGSNVSNDYSETATRPMLNQFIFMHRLIQSTKSPLTTNTHTTISHENLDKNILQNILLDNNEWIEKKYNCVKRLATNQFNCLFIPQITTDE